MTQIYKILAEIQRLKKELKDYSATEAMDYIESYVNLVAQEQSSLLSNLDEVAFTYENDLWESGFKDSGYTPQEVSDAFKAGAEWMAEYAKKDIVLTVDDVELLNRLNHNIMHKNPNLVFDKKKFYEELAKAFNNQKQK